MAQSTSICRLWKKLRDAPGLTLMLLAIALGVLGSIGLLAANMDCLDRIKDILLPLAIMAINISITVLLINGLEKQRFRMLEKRELTKQMASPANRFATEAVHRLGLRGWLQDGSLEGEVFAGANLANVSLEASNLRKADLSNANLTQVNFARANLSEAILLGANLRGTSLYNVDLDGAQLSDSNHLGIVMPHNLEGVVMRRVLAERIDLKERKLGRSVLSGNFVQAEFQHSNLDKADLSNANLVQADFCHTCLTDAKFEPSQLERGEIPK